MRFEVRPAGSTPLSWVEASTRGELGIRNTRGAWICESVEGWYDKSIDLETESLAFTDGEVVVRSSSKGRDIKVVMSKEQGISGDSETVRQSIRRGLGLAHGANHTLTATYSDRDKWRTAGEKEEVSNAWLTGVETEVIGKHIRVELTFRTLDSVITFT